MKKTTVKDLLSSEFTDIDVYIQGWVATKRENKYVAFIALTDGSTPKTIQIVIDKNNFDADVLKEINTGAGIAVNGMLVASLGKGQSVEIQAKAVQVYGTADLSQYPLQKKYHSLEFLRENAHLRMRTATFGAIFRIRHSLAFAIHQYFNENGFFYIHTPVIAGADCEGAGEMFRVTTFDLSCPPIDAETGQIDFKNDFFGRETHLTVSGQLQGELAAMALSKVYTFGPTFRAENSNTPRHLAEFWMIEPEVAFNDLEDNMNLAEDFLKYCIRYIMAHCADDLEFLNNREKEGESSAPTSDMSLLDKLNFVLNNDFVRLTYTEAIEILKNSPESKNNKFEYPIGEWGMDLQSEHERYLVEKHFKKPVILTDYPAAIKAFYMKQSDDGKTVRAMDVLFPGIGEIIGGSQREDNLDKLLHRVREVGIDESTIWWYLDTRRFGSVPHSGFGLGFERLMLFLTGMTNIRDVIPFPRASGSADF